MIRLSRVLPVVFVVAVTTVWFIYNLSLTCVIFFSQTVILFKLYPCFLLTFCYISMLGVFYKHNQAAPKLVNQLHFNHRCSVKIPEKVCFKVNGNCYIGVFLPCFGFSLRCNHGLIVENEALLSVLPYKQNNGFVLKSTFNPVAYTFLNLFNSHEWPRQNFWLC